MTMVQLDPEERHWKELFRLNDPTDISLFFASTYVIIGDGKASQMVAWGSSHGLCS
jgi:hypothetical protein